jgi:glycosyltransferase involved in cell wall biosynthesis
MVRRAKSSPTVSLVVPAKNEASNLREVLPQLPSLHEVILVDGDSTDDTVSVARAVMPDIRVVSQTRKGKGNALTAGFQAATGDIIVMFDADGSADPAEIPAFVEALVGGADFAKGSRFARGGGSEDITPLRSAGNAFLNLVANVAFRTRFTDLCYGYNAFWRDLVPVLDLPDLELPAPASGMLWGDGFEIETLINCRFAAASVSITEVGSTDSDGMRVLRTIFAEHRRKRQLPVVEGVTSIQEARRQRHLQGANHLVDVSAQRQDLQEKSA